VLYCARIEIIIAVAQQTDSRTMPIDTYKYDLVSKGQSLYVNSVITNELLRNTQAAADRGSLVILIMILELPI
jgi:hypothetical protein